MKNAQLIEFYLHEDHECTLFMIYYSSWEINKKTHVAMSSNKPCMKIRFRYTHTDVYTTFFSNLTYFLLSAIANV